MVEKFILDHIAAIVVAAAYFTVAAVQNLPPDNFRFYPWLRGTLLTALPLEKALFAPGVKLPNVPAAK